MTAEKKIGWIRLFVGALIGGIVVFFITTGMYAERVNTNQKEINELKQCDKELQQLIIQTGKDLRDEIKDLKKDIREFNKK